MHLNKIQNVVAAIIKKDNLYLIAKRSRYKHFGLKWEFPGGKVELRETLIEALLREIKEELNISIKVHNKIAEEVFKDDQINIKLHYFICTQIFGSIILSEHEDCKWVKKQDFYNYDFVIGDKNILSLL